MNQRSSRWVLGRYLFCHTTFTDDASARIGFHKIPTAVGLSGYFQSVCYCIDMLGWGLSSRPKFDLTDDSVETAEEFFVESLEAWRAENKIDMMVLVGHSIGGYLSVAYCERYPQNVERLTHFTEPRWSIGRISRHSRKGEARMGSSLWSRAMTTIVHHYVMCSSDIPVLFDGSRRRNLPHFNALVVFP
jgi:pimeloyl-ACP methyl ester carboxylesterase